MDEFELINTFFARPGQRDDVAEGVGDDAAVLTPRPGYQLVMTTDTLVAGRHFPEDLDAYHIGWRSLAVNLSDLAAMGAEPAWCLLNLTLPEVDAAWLEQFSQGFYDLAQEAGIELVGGDTVRGPLSINVQATGQVPAGAALLRRGARPGDRVCVGGVPGEAAAGLAAWQAGHRDGPAVEAFRKPMPQWRLGQKLRRVASACIDISDGVLADLTHILRASGNLGAELELASLPQTEAFAGADPQQRQAWQLGGGDDYLLLFTLPAAVRLPQGCIALGRVAARPGVRLLDEEGKLVDCPGAGFNHFPQGAD